MSEEGRTRFARLHALHEPEVLVALVDAAVACKLLDDLLPLASLLPPHARDVIAEHAPQALARARAASLLAGRGGSGVQQARLVR